MDDDLEITKAERIKILLIEYQVAQQNADAAGDRVWKLTGLLLVTALGSVALMMQARGSWVVFPIALGSIFLIVFWMITFAREQFYSRATDRRMQKIESLLKLDMGLHSYIRWWDEINKRWNGNITAEWLEGRSYIWPRQEVNWLGRRRVRTWALYMAAVSAVVILVVAFGLAWS